MQKLKFYFYYYLGNLIDLFSRDKTVKETKKNPLISVIITCYNYGRYLNECVDSIYRQTYSNIEVILVDDGSDDKETLNIENKLKRKYNKLRLINQTNQGLSKARNNGIKLSKGELICCVDADDKLHSDYLQMCFELFDKKIAFVYSWVQLFGSKKRIWTPLKANRLLITKANCVAVSAVFRKKVWKEIEGFNEKLTLGYEDWDFWYRILKAGWKCDIIKKPLIYHRIHEKNMVYSSDKHRINLIKEIFK